MSFLIFNRQRQHRIDGRRVRSFLEQLSLELGIEGLSFSVVFITDDVIRKYNRNYRGYDKPTDVLSFPGTAHGYLGDILISVQTAHRQAQKSRNLSLEKNIRRLLLHGVLHLMGYDHETDQGQMRAIERRLRRRLEC